jgi:hypothetical protein
VPIIIFNLADLLLVLDHANRYGLFVYISVLLNELPSTSQKTYCIPYSCMPLPVKQLNSIS